MSHTPGPWELEGRMVLGKCFTGDLRAICDTVRGQTPIQAHGNARLISASPDLLEALEPFAKFAEHWDASERRGLAQRDEDALYTVSFLPDQPPVSITLGHVRAARAAIKKARGE